MMQPCGMRCHDLAEQRPERSLVHCPAARAPSKRSPIGKRRADDLGRKRSYVQAREKAEDQPPSK